MPGPALVLQSAQCLHNCPLQAQNFKLLRTAPRTGPSVHFARPAKQWRFSSKHTCTAGELTQVTSVPEKVQALDLLLLNTGTAKASAGLWTPDHSFQLPDVQAAAAPAVVSPGSGYEDHKPRTPPPDLPSLLLDSRITYLGMPVSQCSAHARPEH